jgi:NodT family efflux transporter outer membrane factor (OMF) lipoprotein
VNALSMNRKFAELNPLPLGAVSVTLIFGLLALSLTGCMVGPKYQKPASPAPPTFKEDAGWIPAQPADTLTRGKWWQVYNDPELNALEEKINVSNQTLKAAFEAYQSAHQQVSIQRADLFPTLGVNPSVSRTQESVHRPLYSPLAGSSLYNDFQVPGSASWEPDLWGRVRHLVEASRTTAQASAADLETMSLSLHAELANEYFELRGLDLQKQLLDSTVVVFEKSVDLTRSRFKGGLASASDLALAQTQLDTTRAQDIDVGVARAQVEHAIATLTGEPASSFSLPPAPLTATPPSIPVGLPSLLLQRRPDIAAAERRVAAANEEIGVARSAYYPTILLSGGGGVESTALGTLVQGPSALWSIGASASETIFDAGRRHAQNQQALANYNQTVALYRQQVLQSFQDVEDYLAALRILEGESKAQQDAVADAQRSENLSLIRYKGGLATYLEVITTQSTALADERTLADLETRRMSASVLLVKAIGGTWDTSQLPHN